MLAVAVLVVRHGGECGVRSGYAFPKETREPLHRAWVSGELHRLAFEGGFPPICLHDLRHGHPRPERGSGREGRTGVARSLLSEVVSKAYTSVTDDLKREAANPIASLIIKAAQAPSMYGSVTRPPTRRSR